MNIAALILIAATTAAAPVPPFTKAMTEAKAEMALAYAALERGRPALEKRDMEHYCPAGQEAHIHFAKARDIFENARIWYLKNQPDQKQEQQYLAEDRDMMARQMAEIDIILVTGCGGIKPPVGSQ